MLDYGLFSRYKSIGDFQREQEEFDARKRQAELQNKLASLNVQQIEQQVSNPSLSPEQLIAKSIQIGGVGNLTPQEQAQLQAFDIAQRMKQSVDPRGNVITNRSVFDMLPGQVSQMPPRQVMNMPMPQAQGTPGIIPEQQPAAAYDINQPMPNAADQLVPLPDLAQQGMMRPTMQPAAQTPAQAPLPQIGVDPAAYGVTSPYGQEDLAKQAANLELEAQAKRKEKMLAIPEEAKASQRAFTSLLTDADNIFTRVNDAIGKTGLLTAGFGSLTSEIPGTPGADLKSALKTIQADAAFSRLQQMRDSSKTGGALGQVSEKELALLQNAKIALDQEQSPPQLRKNLEEYKQIRLNAIKNVAEAYRQDYGSYPAGFEEFVSSRVAPPTQIDRGQIKFLGWE